MATETESGLTGHTRSVVVTTIVSLGGVGAGVAAATVAAGPTDTLGLIAVLAAAAIELVVMRLLGVDIGEFGAKDHLYIFFMTFALWFVTWGVLLMSGVQ
ncbi:EMC6-like membrane protein [Halanaeroarchaeum sulfurireducens]|uniref:Uncharacterized protein n=1 Tax=Halanaeroarchaeum sulfurireducens TaxID=1604004 RepID=A0A0F7P846_9EURY|nr:hypothetical protein [Halanaeroarchaeum sulfurireducens]AKH96897.1 hypothetical protein HLASF_0391 [Halanaeroarchaeum sulfurireducens]ALG81299.1 hypothetical protein HLASA_0390 [Halanaeroarchaeum sulfurireducens]